MWTPLSKNSEWFRAQGVNYAGTFIKPWGAPAAEVNMQNSRHHTCDRLSVTFDGVMQI
jgi:hypothetical protein